jgi:hypothetical protein
MTRARRSHPAVARFLLLLAFLVQSTYVQAHVHVAPLAAAAGIAAAESASHPAEDSSQHGPGDASSHCFQCWEAAVAGQYVAPPAVVLSPAPQSDRWVAVEGISEFGLGKSAHGWLSRAPPQ